MDKNIKLNTIESTIVICLAENSVADATEAAGTNGTEITENDHAKSKHNNE